MPLQSKRLSDNMGRFPRNPRAATFLLLNPFYFSFFSYFGYSSRTTICLSLSSWTALSGTWWRFSGLSWAKTGPGDPHGSSPAQEIFSFYAPIGAGYSLILCTHGRGKGESTYPSCLCSSMFLMSLRSSLTSSVYFLRPLSMTRKIYLST